jgi:hypothetical protein
MIRDLRIAASAGCLLIASGCATLPDTQFLTQDYQAQAGVFKTRGANASRLQVRAILLENEK